MPSSAEVGELTQPTRLVEGVEEGTGRDRRIVGELNGESTPLAPEEEPSRAGHGAAVVVAVVRLCPADDRLAVQLELCQLTRLVNA